MLRCTTSIYQYKQDIQKKYKFLLISLIVVLFYSLIKSSYTGPILISVLGIILALAGRKRYKTNIVIVLFVFIVFIAIPRENFAKLFYAISSNIENPIIRPRINSIGNVFEFGVQSDNVIVEERLQRIPYNINLFFDSPIFGSGDGNGHLFWLYVLAKFGVIGLIPIILLLTKEIRSNSKRFNSEFNYYYFLSITLFILLGLIKAIAGRDIYILLFLIIPGIYYLKYSSQPRLPNSYARSHKP